MHVELWRTLVYIFNVRAAGAAAKRMKNFHQSAIEQQSSTLSRDKLISSYYWSMMMGTEMGEMLLLFPNVV
jgi:hypothetical protein